jgi:hypothetical protein
MTLHANCQLLEREGQLSRAVVAHVSDVDKWAMPRLLRDMVPMAQPLPVVVHHRQTVWTAPPDFPSPVDAQTMADAEQLDSGHQALES